MLSVPPRPPARRKHIPPEDPGADVLESLGGEGLVGARVPARLLLHLLEGAGVDEPVVDCLAADAEWGFEGLVRAGAVAVEGDGV